MPLADLVHIEYMSERHDTALREKDQSGAYGTKFHELVTEAAWQRELRATRDPGSVRVGLGTRIYRLNNLAGLSRTMRLSARCDPEMRAASRLGKHNTAALQ